MFTEWNNTEEFAKELSDTAYINPESLMNINKGHAITTHTDLSDMELIKRMLRENKEIVSNFADIEDYPVIHQIRDAIVYKADEISDWACSKRREFSDPREYNKLVLEVNLGYDLPIGYGFKADLQKYATDIIRIVLKRDNSGENQFGFYVATAYPCIEKGYPENIRFEEKDLLEKTNELSVLEKMKLGINGYSCSSRIEINRLTGELELAIFVKVSDKESYVAYMGEKNLQIKSYRPDLTKIVSKEYIRDKCPELSNAINKAELFRDVALTVKEKQTRDSFLVQKTCNKDKDTLELS